MPDIREINITIRYTKKERKRLEKEARQHDMYLTQYIRYKSLL